MANSEIQEGQPYNVRICHGYKLYMCRIGGHEYEFAEPTAEKAKENLEDKRYLAGLNHELTGNRLRNINAAYYRQNMTEEIMIVQDYVSGFKDYRSTGYGLYIWSHQPGSGKTKLATAVANELIDQGFDVYYSSVASLYTRIKGTYSQESKQSEESVMRKLANVDLLVLDDLNSSSDLSKWEDDKMFEIVNSRIERKRPIVFTSNLEPEKLMYNKRTISRISGASEVIHWAEEDVRAFIGQVEHKARVAKWKTGLNPSLGDV